MTHDPLTLVDTHGRHIFREYRVPLPRLLVVAFMGLFWGVIALCCAGAFLFTSARTPHPDWGIALLFQELFALPLATLGIFLLSRCVTLCGFRAALDNTGLMLWTYRDRTAAPWDDVTALYVGAYPRPHLLVRGVLLLCCPIPYLLIRAEARRRYTVCLRDGRRLHIPSAFPGRDALARVIGSAVTEHQLPAILGRCREGEGCDFGAVYVSCDGLHMRKKVLLWEDLDRITWNRTTLCIFRRGKRRSWGRVPLPSLPNPGLFLALVEQLSAEARHT